MEKIIFCPEGVDQEVSFYVLEQTRIGGVNYILVTEEEEGDGEAYILKDLSEDGELEARYEMVSSDEELAAVGDIFAKMLEDIDLENPDGGSFE